MRRILIWAVLILAILFVAFGVPAIEIFVFHKFDDGIATLVCVVGSAVVLLLLKRHYDRKRVK